MDIFVLFGKFYRNIFCLVMRLEEKKDFFVTNEQWQNMIKTNITRKTFFRILITLLLLQYFSKNIISLSGQGL